MIQVLPIDDKFIEANQEFLKTVQEAIKIGVSINIPSGLDNQPEIVSRFNLIEEQVKQTFDQVFTVVNIPGVLIQFLFGSMECLVTCILLKSGKDTEFSIQLARLSHKTTFTPQ